MKRSKIEDMPERTSTPSASVEPHYHHHTWTHHHQSLVGTPVAAIVGRMLDGASSDGRAAAGAAAAAAAADPADDLTAPEAAATAAATAHAEFSIAWPPTFPVGGHPAEVIELRAALSYRGCDATASAAARFAAAAAASRCSRLLAVREDVVVGDESVKMVAGGGGNTGRARARLRLHSDSPGVTSCILTGDQGIPTLESFQDAAPLMGLPQAAREEAHRLLWRMMHEALPYNHSVLPYDADAFRSPVDLLPPKLQAALSWAWSHHFRPFAHDFSFLLDCMPYSTSAATAATCTAGGGGYGDESAGASVSDADDAVSHYQSVLAQMVGFLRDNEMFACLATLLQTAVARGLALLGDDGSCMAATPPVAAATTAATAAPPAPPSPSVVSDAGIEQQYEAVAAEAVAGGDDGDEGTAAPDPVLTEDAVAAAEGEAAGCAGLAAAALPPLMISSTDSLPPSSSPRRAALHVLQLALALAAAAGTALVTYGRGVDGVRWSSRKFSVLLWIMIMPYFPAAAARITARGGAAASATWRQRSSYHHLSDDSAGLSYVQCITRRMSRLDSAVTFLIAGYSSDSSCCACGILVYCLA
ncbi:hypothetical protein VOLCADRAFT_96685 [Volvox carteri f. nagariensis]|uniref:Uncharacterized protein n=1 Tax=Volvox carteri f. nagariensis TaxID=3068 RepID=D8UAS7_VOLCA|nr:uncharacterized protein VOLCADRAFT_96685 [Volvox carteri f. nagariensis]EFJ43153.1 hypothetical protein VOLCADRAFT_96685 [Volvox carteri f. nagariensis]|eukprot:XP_002955728.1 hypothetical protein VOLCADRAFT_96685 [Volvox carteri f. nagariensis]